MKHSAIFNSSFFILQLLLLAGLVFLLGRCQSLPQIARGEDVLSIAFGDAREVISLAAVQKADSYFHGGVDMEDDHHDIDMEHSQSASADDAGNASVPGPAETAVDIGRSFPDPWQWIDVRVRAPQVHKHLDGDKSVELLPWFWVSVKADPHNADAWSTAWYVAKFGIKDEELAARVLEEAKEKNPDSIEIAFTEGRAIYDGGKGDHAAARKVFERARALGYAKCGGDVSKLTVHEEEAYRWSGNYLETMDKKKSE